MTVEKLAQVLNADILTCAEDKDKQVTGCYVCDLLSLAMSKVQAGDAWITVQTNINIAAVAVLTDASCVVVAEGMHIEDSVTAKASSEGVTIIKTQMSAFDAAMEIGKLL